MINENKHRYSNVELFDIIKNGTNKRKIKHAKSALESRNLTKKQRIELESEYLKYKTFKENRKNEPLTNEEWLTFFIFPFLAPNLSPPHTFGINDDYSESEMERFQKYGFEKKIEQAEKVKIFGIIFWLSTIVIAGIIIAKFR